MGLRGKTNKKENKLSRAAINNHFNVSECGMVDVMKRRKIKKRYVYQAESILAEKQVCFPQYIAYENIDSISIVAVELNLFLFLIGQNDDGV